MTADSFLIGLAIALFVVAIGLEAHRVWSNRCARLSQAALTPPERGHLSPGPAPADRGSIIEEGGVAHDKGGNV